MHWGPSASVISGDMGTMSTVGNQHPRRHRAGEKSKKQIWHLHINSKKKKKLGLWYSKIPRRARSAPRRFGPDSWIVNPSIYLVQPPRKPLVTLLNCLLEDSSSILVMLSWTRLDFKSNRAWRHTCEGVGAVSNAFRRQTRMKSEMMRLRSSYAFLSPTASFVWIQHPKQSHCLLVDMGLDNNESIVAVRRIELDVLWARHGGSAVQKCPALLDATMKDTNVQIFNIVTV